MILPLKPEKTILPTTIVIYGIEFDSIKLECRLPVEKVIKTKVALENAHKKKKITLRSRVNICRSSINYSR
jgi:hypothetical protein